MGSGSSKAHEAFPISPSAKPLDASATDMPALAPSAGSDPEADPGLEPVALPADHVDPAPATKGAAAVWDQSAAWESAEVITPIPEELTPGDPNGTGLIVGGADLENSELTLMSYVNGSDTQELLYGWVHPDAEAKLLAALDTDESGLIPAELTKTVHGRLPLDDEHKIFESLVKYAKSVNHHAKAGNPPPAHTVEGLAQLQEELAALSEGSDVSAADKAMIADYLAKSDLIEQRCAAGFDKPYANGGKIPTLTAHEAEYLKTWTEMVQDPDAEQSGLATQKVKTTRGACKLVAGESQWDGTRKPDGKGQEYKIDLGDGFVARYRPHGQLDAAKGRQGSLEIQAPPGSGHAGELVGRLAQLNLISRPLTGAEAEWTYLSRNAWAQGIDTSAPTKAALASAAGLDETMQEVLFAEHAHEAVGLSEGELDSWARRIRLEAEAKALPFKVKVIRDAVSAQLGYSSGEALQTAPGYNPTPITEGTGFHTWNRFDVAGDTTLPGKFASKVLTQPANACWFGTIRRGCSLVATGTPTTATSSPGSTAPAKPAAPKSCSPTALATTKCCSVTASTFSASTAPTGSSPEAPKNANRSLTGSKPKASRPSAAKNSTR